MIRDKESIRLIISTIIENADAVKAGDQNEVTQGELIAYTDVLDIIRLVLTGEDLASLGLDFIPEARYL